MILQQRDKIIIMVYDPSFDYDCDDDGDAHDEHDEDDEDEDDNDKGLIVDLDKVVQHLQKEKDEIVVCWI